MGCGSSLASDVEDMFEDYYTKEVRHKILYETGLSNFETDIRNISAYIKNRSRRGYYSYLFVSDERKKQEYMKVLEKYSNIFIFTDVYKFYEVLRYLMENNVRNTFIIVDNVDTINFNNEYVKKLNKNCKEQNIFVLFTTSNTEKKYNFEFDTVEAYIVKDLH